MNAPEQEFLKALGNRVRQVRKAKGYTQMQLAVKIKNHEQQIGRIERGEVNVKVVTLHTVAKGLDVNLQDLMDF